MSGQRQIVFFDGVCNLCNGFVDFLMKRDSEHLFDLASLQGETAKRLLPERLHQGLGSVVLWSQGEIFEKSDAVLMVGQQLGGAWAVVRVFWMIPRFARDAIYRIVAANRYRIFGKRESCRLPSPEERTRFLG